MLRRFHSTAHDYILIAIIESTLSIGIGIYPSIQIRFHFRLPLFVGLVVPPCTFLERNALPYHNL